MLIIGLTGGISSGKTTVSHHFESLGVPVIDADIIAHELVAPGQPALAEIAQQFGNDCLATDGSLDRRALRQRVFRNADERKKLEAILHPRVRDEIRRRVEALQSIQAPPAYCILSIPLLVESGWTELVQRVLVVDSSPEAQLRRTQQRDGIDAEQAEAIIRSQTPRETRLAAADDIIHNDADLPALHAQVDELHQRYLQLARSC